jgi:anti-anti-sigma factor
MLDPAVHADPLFDVHVSACGTTWTVVVAGEIDVAVADQFEAAIATAIGEASETVVIDLTALDFIDSSGIHALVRARDHADARRRRLVIVPAAERVQNVFRICGLDTVLPFVPMPTTA